jgi:GTP-binding protein EngB required for normal cell division
MDLREYERHKFAIADLLRQMAPEAPDRQQWRDRTTPLFARLAEDRFNLVLVGRFSRGKSSLVNAILGMDSLPTGIVPLTSVITSVSYGSVERVVLRFARNFMDQEVPLAALPDYVTQEANPGNVKGIKEAEVQLPAEFLRRGFHFVDTPGVGSAIEENTRTTESYLAEADAFLLVTSFDSPLSADESLFFRAIASSPRRVFVVLNKQDLASERQRAEAVEFVRQRLGAMFRQDTPKVFAISALQALQAKQTLSPSLLEESGIVSLERELIGFLLTEKRSQFLLRMCDRLVELIRGLPRNTRTADVASQIEALSRRIADDSAAAPRRDLDSSPIVDDRTAAQLRPCQICASTSDALWEFQRRYQYEIMINPAAQQDLARRGGFCSFHTWLYESNASPQGVAEGYPPVLENWASWLREAAANMDSKALVAKFAARLPNAENCVYCGVRARSERASVSALARQLVEDPSHSLESLSALCLPHLAQLTAEVPNESLVLSLIHRQAALLDRLAEDLKRSALKHDGIRRTLLSEEEASASKRALALLARTRPLSERSR